MPGMNGKELADKITSMLPDIKVLLMSGYTDNVIAHHGALESKYTLLNKPLLPVTLANRIREVLNNINNDKTQPKIINPTKKGRK